MKILAIGDFDGKFPKKYLDIIKKEKIDLVVSDGDYPPFTLKKEFFEFVYANPFPVELWDVVGKKRYKEAVKKDHLEGESVMKKLNLLPIPVLSVLGNHDYQIPDDCSDISRSSDWDWSVQEMKFLSNAMKKYKHIKRIDYSYAKVGGFVFIGARGSSFPGQVKSKGYKKHKAKLDKLFKTFSKENKQGKVIFVSHNSPHNTKLDLITSKEAHSDAKGRHFGSKMFRRVLDKHQPILSISGHIDEAWGKQNLGRTLAVNCGAVHDGRGAVIDVKESGKIKVRFIK
jgi:Icc-related predicted phosphoesterase